MKRAENVEIDKNFMLIQLTNNNNCKILKYICRTKTKICKVIINNK